MLLRGVCNIVKLICNTVAAIPVNLLWKTRINLRQKLALLSLFSLTTITMIFAIIRVEVAIRGAREDDSWFYLCTSLEMTIGQSKSHPPRLTASKLS